MFNIITYALAAIALGWSFTQDRQKTRQALVKAWKTFSSIMPDFAGILALVGLALSVLSPAAIQSVLGGRSGWVGMALASIVGAITLIPGFVAFPLAASLLHNGAGVMQIAVFVSTLMMVGIVTLPLERRYFGSKATYLRNGLSFIFSFVAAIILGVVVK